MDYNITLIQPDTYNVKMDNVVKVEPPQESIVVKSTEEEQVIIPQDVLYNKVVVEKLELQTKEIEPQQSAQVVVADEGYDGLKQVNINAVTSEIDDNIIPSNIKKGISILGVNGNLEVPDFSDTTATANDVVEGKQFFNASGELTTGAYKDMLQARVDATNSCAYLFYNYGGTNLDFISGLDTSNAISMEYMFNKCSKLTNLDLSNFDTSKVISMYNVFKGCGVLTEILGTIDMIKVINCSDMFTNCSKLTNVTLKNIKLSLQIGSGTRWGHLLTLDCLINTIKELWDYSSGTTTYTLTIGSANIEKIANTYVKLITPTEEQIAADPNIVNKKPCEVCESTDEGAMTLTEYATSKKWAIA